MTIMALEGTGADVFAAGGAGGETDALGSRAKRTSRAAGERRKTVLGSTGGPSRPGARGRPAVTARRSSGGKQAKGAKGKGVSFDLDSLAGKTNGGPLLAEFAAGVIIIVLGSLTRGPSQGYLNVMSELMLRLTALTTVFFTLFLLSGTKGGKAAVWFGLLVDLGILFTAATENVLTQAASVVAGTPIGGDVLTDAAVATEPPPSVTLPSDQPSATAQQVTTAVTTAATAVAAA